jgi:aryl-alcohol dehydrogenase-like predicted oxidoreductase
VTSNRLILGTSNLGLIGGRETAFGLLDAYFELGGRTIDTANVYSDWVPGESGRSETVIGEWMAARGNRDQLTIVTKGAHPPLGRMHEGRCDRASIRHDIEQSLRRLQTDRVELYYLHRDEPTRPVAEIMATLNELIGEGKVGALGCSNWRLARIAEARATAGVTFTANQVLGNALCRIMEPLGDPTNYVLDAPMFHDAVDNGLSLQLYTSQCQGLFEKRARGAAPPHNYDNPACAEAAAKIEAIAAAEGVAPGNLIVAFLTALAPNVRPIIGPRDAGQLQHSYAAGEFTLRPETVRAIAEAGGMQDFLRA